MTPNDQAKRTPDRLPSRVLVAQTTYAGDLLLALPLVLRISETLPGASVDMLVSADLAPLAAACPAVHRVHILHKEAGHPSLRTLLLLARDLRQGSYDCAITMPGSIRTALAMVLARIPRRIGWDPGSLLTTQVQNVKYPAATRQLSSARGTLAFESWYRMLAPIRGFFPALYTDVLTHQAGIHRAEEALDALSMFAVRPAPVPQAPWLRMPDEIVKEVDACVPGSSGGWVVMAPGATQPTRRWPVEHMGELARLLALKGHQVVVIGTEEDRAAAEGICAAAGSAGVHSLAGRTSILAVCEIIRRARVVVANDSAPVHMASAMGTPVLALFGPTMASFGFAPLAPHSIVQERHGLMCRPCTVYGSTTCPIGTHECLRSIAPPEVLAAIGKILAGAADRPAAGQEGNV